MLYHILSIYVSDLLTKLENGLIDRLTDQIEGVHS